MSLPPPREGSRDTGEGLIISKYPDVCRSPTAPVPYTIVAWQSDDANTAASVRMTGQRAHKQTSIVTRCTGDEPGTGLGVKSNTVTSVCHRKEHSRTVRIEGQWATRHNDEWFMNNRNTVGKLNWYTGARSFEPTPPIRYAFLDAGTGATASDAAPAQARAAAPAPAPRPSVPNPITPQNPQPNRPSGTPQPGVNDNAKPAAPSRWWAWPSSIVNNLTTQLRLYQEAWRRWRTMPERLKEAQRRDGVIPDQQQLGAQLERQFKGSDFGRDYPGTFEDFTRLNEAEQQAAIENWMEEQRRKKAEAGVDAPPVPNTRTEGNVRITEDEERKKRVLCHYTDQKGVAGILSTQSILPSLKAKNPKDAFYGDGQYLSDIPPGTRTNAQLSRIFIGQPFQGSRFSNFVCIDVTGLNVVPGRPHVFVVPNKGPLNVTGRIVGSGRNE